MNDWTPKPPEPDMNTAHSEMVFKVNDSLCEHVAACERMQQALAKAFQDELRKEMEKVDREILNDESEADNG